jgi:ABC-type cobalamin transport system permease subunit
LSESDCRNHPVSYAREIVGFAMNSLGETPSATRHVTLDVRLCFKRTGRGSCTRAWVVGICHFRVAKTEWISSVDRVIPHIRIRLSGFVNHRVDGEERAGRRVVVAIDCVFG